MFSGGCVLVTAIRAISSGCRPERRAAVAIRLRIDSTFSRRDIAITNFPTARGRLFLQSADRYSRLREKGGQECPPHILAPKCAYMIAVGGAGSLGSPAAETGRKTMSAAKPASTIIPPTRYDGSLKTCGG